MNKYQKALDRVALNFGLDCLDEALEENEQDNLAHDISLLNELVERATPKKPAKVRVSYCIGYDDVATDDAYECPICGKRIADDYMDGNRYDYCMHCGQSIDWSKKE